MSIEEMMGFGLTKEERRQRDQTRAREAMDRFARDPRFSDFFAPFAKNETPQPDKTKNPAASLKRRRG